jgi:hypothetical protein
MSPSGSPGPISTRRRSSGSREREGPQGPSARPSTRPSRDRSRAGPPCIPLPCLRLPGLLHSPGTPPVPQAEWVSGPGEGWADLTLFLQDTRKTYQLDGARREIFAESRARTVSAFFTSSLGLIRARMHGPRPPHPPGPSRRHEAGRRRLRRGREGHPLEEGQRDWELLLEVGRSFHPAPLRISRRMGHRWREDNRKAARNPGNEWFSWASSRGSLGRIGWQLSLEGIHGDTWIIQGIPIRSVRREILQVLSSMGTDVLVSHLRVGGRTTLSGRNLPPDGAEKRTKKRLGARQRRAAARRHWRRPLVGACPGRDEPGSEPVSRGWGA